MCNLSKGIEEKGLERGREEGREEGIKALVETLLSLGMEEEKAAVITAERYKISVEKVKEIVGLSLSYTL